MHRFPLEQGRPVLIRWLWYRGFVWTLTRLWLGVNLRHPERLPQDGPAILVANHNSHLDAMLLVTLLPARLLPRIRPVAAADYFLRNRLMAWFALKVIGILPISRSGGEDPLARAAEALERGDLLIFFPEGTRGEPEQLAAFKSGLWHLLKRHPRVPVHPVFMHGLGKSLPRGEGLLVPFVCDAFAGEPLAWQEDKAAFMTSLKTCMDDLASEGHFAPWT